MKGPLTKVVAYQAGEWTFRNRSFYDIGEEETVPVITEYLEDGTKVYRQRTVRGGLWVHPERPERQVT